MSAAGIGSSQPNNVSTLRTVTQDVSTRSDAAFERVITEARQNLEQKAQENVSLRNELRALVTRHETDQKVSQDSDGIYQSIIGEFTRINSALETEVNVAKQQAEAAEARLKTAKDQKAARLAAQVAAAQAAAAAAAEEARNAVLRAAHLAACRAGTTPAQITAARQERFNNMFRRRW